MSKNIKTFSKKIIKNKRGQGATEYILLLVVVVGVVMMFKKQIISTLQGKLGELQGSISGVTPE